MGGCVGGGRRDGLMDGRMDGWIGIAFSMSRKAAIQLLPPDVCHSTSLSISSDRFL